MIVFKLNSKLFYGAVRVEDQRFIDLDHYKFTFWQTRLNFAVFCASSAYGVYVEHMNAKKPMKGFYIAFIFAIISGEY